MGKIKTSGSFAGKSNKLRRRSPMSDNTKAKISFALLGNKNGLGNHASLGRTPWNKGLTVPEEHKKYLSDIQKGKHNSPQTEIKKGQRISPGTEFTTANGGRNHWNWQGGLTSQREKLRKSQETRTWRKSIFERDNYTCRICLNRGGRLHADHVKPWSLFPELRYALTNGRTLCENCHKGTDTYLKPRNKLMELFKEELCQS